MCMLNAAYIFLRWQFLFPVEAAVYITSLGSVGLWLSRGGVNTEGRLPPKVTFHRRSSSTEGFFPTKGRLLLKVVFQQRLSSTEGCLPPKVVFHWRSSSTYQNTLVDLIFCENSEHTKSQPPTLLRSGLKWFGQTKRTNQNTQSNMLVHYFFF